MKNPKNSQLVRDLASFLVTYEAADLKDALAALTDPEKGKAIEGFIDIRSAADLRSSIERPETGGNGPHPESSKLDDQHVANEAAASLLSSRSPRLKNQISSVAKRHSIAFVLSRASSQRVGQLAKLLETAPRALLLDLILELSQDRGNATLKKPISKKNKREWVQGEVLQQKSVGDELLASRPNEAEKIATILALISGNRHINSVAKINVLTRRFGISAITARNFAQRDLQIREMLSHASAQLMDEIINVLTPEVEDHGTLQQWSDIILRDRNKTR